MPAPRDGTSLALVTFLQRVVDVFEDFLGSPLLATNIESNYSVVAQLLTEICDGGIICNTEPNTLHDQVEMSSGLVNKLFNQVGIPHAAPPALGSAASSTGLSHLKSAIAIPWRRPNVRHTSNEVYVDILESLSLLLAPSGRPIRYLARGSILFTSKISGVPDLVLILSAPGGTSSSKALAIQRTMTLPSFHPCVRLSRWKENAGELSFIPPDGKFVLASYETDLMPSQLDQDEVAGKNEKVFVPASVDLRTGLGAKGNEFEAKLRLDTKFAGARASHRSVTELNASRGDANWVVKAGSREVEWKVSTSGKDGSVSGTAVLTGVVMGAPGHNGADDRHNGAAAHGNADKRALSEYYDEATVDDLAKTMAWARSRSLMPRSISVSFTVKGWLASGIRVDSLTVDAKKSRGLGEGVRPYKGVKYVSVSHRGIERRVE
ncbi:hypothetical protein DV737_g742, partial [Chaetothyriales sp. CBS 132003]